jgi:thiol-disulfide isomerase/thioredoxin
MKKFLIVMVVFFGLLQAYNEFRPTPRFGTAADALRVERLGGDGDVIHEYLKPRLTPYLAVYHGAGWCEPCQEFAPRLAEFYHDADKTRHRFQLVMVNYDHSEGEMVAYMRQHNMEFPAIMRGDAGSWGTSTGNGIPNLIIIDTMTGKVVSSSFDGSTYQGCDVPLNVLRTIVAQGHP